MTATPARHGPAGIDRGQVPGFVLFFVDAPGQAIYISCDTVWHEGLSEVASRSPVQVATLHLGAARVPVVDSFHLTMTAEEAFLAAGAFGKTAIVPIHFEDWAHFSEGRAGIKTAFANARLENRLRWPERDRTILIDLNVPLEKAG